MAVEGRSIFHRRLTANSGGGHAEATGLPFSDWIYDTVELHLNSGQASPWAKAIQKVAALKKLEVGRVENHITIICHNIKKAL